MNENEKVEEIFDVHLAQRNRDYSTRQTPLGQHPVAMKRRDVLVEEFFIFDLFLSRRKE